MLDLIDLHFDYPDRHVLKGVSLSVNAGQLMHLRGNNGAGKTTLLKLLAGIIQPTKGDIYYEGGSIHKDITTYQNMLCYIGHKTGVSQVLTIRENCHFDLLYGRNGLSYNELIRAFALEGLDDVICGMLSAGQRRRVGLLRLLMSDARIWLLDEPLVALDQQTISILMSFVQQHLAKGGLIILTSHQTLPLKKENYQEYCL